MNSTQFDSIVSVFKTLQTFKTGFKARAYKSAIQKLNQYRSKHGKSMFSLLRTLPSLLQDIGFKSKSKMFEKCLEIIETGTLQELTKYTDSPDQQFIKLLTEYAYGIGHKKAQELVNKHDIHSIEELRASAEEIQENGRPLLNNLQQIGLRYIEDLQTRIPHKEVKRFDKYCGTKIKELEKRGLTIHYLVAGSYRRKAPTSGDIDILLCMETTGNKRKPSLRKIVAQLGDCICDTLTLGTKKFHGLIRHPDYPELPARRIDIMCTTPEVYPYAVLHFTGSGVHNITMRQRANELNYTLNEYGLWHTENLDKLVNPAIRTEEEIFQELSMDYVTPECR